MIRAVLLEDHPAVQAVIAPLPDVQPVGSAVGEPAIWGLLDRTRAPDVLIMDLHHPRGDGLALCLEIKRQPDAPAVLVYSASIPAALTVAAGVAGVDAIVSKASPTAALIEAIRAVASPIRPGLSITPMMKAEAAATLDPGDHAIFAMRLAGDSPIEIGATFGISGDTTADRTRSIVARLARLTAAPAPPMLVLSDA